MTEIDKSKNFQTIPAVVTNVHYYFDSIQRLH